MTVTSRITAQVGASEHPDNGVQRGVDATHELVKAATLLGRLAAGWKECDRLDVQFLRALVALTLSSPDKAAFGFDPREVAEEIGRVRGRKWINDPTDGVSDKVRDQWNRMSGETWGKKVEGIQQEFAKRGAAFVPVLDRIEGGGTGNPTRYRLLLQPASSGEGPATGRAEEPGQGGDGAPSWTAPQRQPDQAGVTYICEDVEDAAWPARGFAKGFQLVGWKRQALRVVLMFGVLSVGLTVLLVALTIHQTRSLADSANVAFAATVIAYAVWITLGHLMMLHRWRIALAPWWMQSIDDDRLLEWRCPPRYSERAIKAVRYTATCPLCGGKVVTRSGGLRYVWALVGRCEEATAAHVFGFDHVMREGRRLG